jgi:hypothetical protein
MQLDPDSHYQYKDGSRTAKSMRIQLHNIVTARNLYLNSFRPGRGSWLNPVLVKGGDDVAAVVRLLAGHEHQAVFVILHSRVSKDKKRKFLFREEKVSCIRQKQNCVQPIANI